MALFNHMCDDVDPLPVPRDDAGPKLDRLERRDFAVEKGGGAAEGEGMPSINLHHPVRHLPVPEGGCCHVGCERTSRGGGGALPSKRKGNLFHRWRFGNSAWNGGNGEGWKPFLPPGRISGLEVLVVPTCTSEPATEDRGDKVSAGNVKITIISAVRLVDVPVNLGHRCERGRDQWGEQGPRGRQVFRAVHVVEHCAKDPGLEECDVSNVKDTTRRNKEEMIAHSHATQGGSS